MKYYNKVISVFLGGSMFIFGFLKFFNPFKNWYTVQIAASKLGSLSYAMGITGELVIGLTLLILPILQVRLSSWRYTVISSIASAGVVAMMGTGIYVHLHPDVPAAVLPLGIKPPLIPLFFLATALVNVTIVINQYRISKRDLMI